MSTVAHAHDSHAASHGADAHDDGKPHIHVTSPLLLLGVFGALLVLTVLTVAVTSIDLGPLNIWIALFVAVAKGGLVVMYFMHLRWDSYYNGIILIVSLFFIALFIGIAILDTKEYQPNMEAPHQGQVLPVQDAR